jgi:hypothetical protein
MRDSEKNSSDWIFRHALPFTRLLRETENACVDRITEALRPIWDSQGFTKVGNQTIDGGYEPEIHTAAWLAMRSWKEEIEPYYEKLISMPDLGVTTRRGLDDRYGDFLCTVALALAGCEQYAAAKKLLLEGQALFRCRKRRTAAHRPGP